MKTTPRPNLPGALWLLILLSASPVFAQSHADRIDELEARTLAMAEELAILRAELDKERQAPDSEDMRSIRAESVAARQAAQNAEIAASEWKNSDSVTHLAGYASADYVSPENGNAAFVANFNPMFHFQYKDRILWEAEIEVEIEENGDTSMGLEYSTIDLFLNNNMVLLAGKFLSPVGNFRQNIHPSWINKLPSAPPGFGHDGAAPLAEVGVQLRGGFKIGEQSRMTYAGFIGNGPKLEGEDGEIHGIDTDGFTGDPDDEKVFGGRISLLPLPKLELAVSGAFGDAAVVENDGVDFEGDPTRDYKVFGVDASYQWNNLDLRGEFIRQDIANEATSIAPEGGVWETWYLQGAYKFADAKWEGVARYTDYKSPHPDKSQEQWALGVNYLLAPSAMLKFAYESNTGLAGESTDDDRWLVQIAYGY